jgi:hypothetical protein
MAYHCKDCSYRGRQRGDLGGCPACGSFNIALAGAAAAPPPQPPGRRRMALLLISWGLFLALAGWKLLA